LTISNFDDLGLHNDILKAVKEVGYETPTEIQAKAIPAILMMKDIIGIAQTGTGKTGAFTLPMIEVLQGGVAKARMPRALVLTPTRELAAQVAENIELYSKYLHLSHALIVGGVQANDQIAKLERGVDILIATPGRLLDLQERGNVLLRDIKFLVIDEADRMLDMGFIPDIEKIIGFLPALRQNLLFSATMPKPIQKLAEKLMDNPKVIEIERQSSTTANVTQKLIIVQNEASKVGHLVQFLKDKQVDSAFIFCNRKRDIDKYAVALEKAGIKASPLHGDMSQSARTSTLQKFKDRELDILVCSDVAARGIDVSDVSHVFNMDLPTNAEDYVHRIGRTGRAGKEGEAFSFVVLKTDEKYLEAIEGIIGNAIGRIELTKPKIVKTDQKQVKNKSNSRQKSQNEVIDTDSPIGFGNDLPDFMAIGR
jgi:superfamily II DNA/RNA helicase